TLHTKVTQPVFNLDAASDSGVAGDLRTKFDTVTLTGKTDPGATVTLSPTNTTTTADGSGQFSFTGVKLKTGANSFTAKATDSLGNTNSFTQTITLDSAPTVSTPIADVKVAMNASPTVINLSNNFADVDVVDTIVRFNTSSGPVDVELFDQKT